MARTPIINGIILVFAKINSIYFLIKFEKSFNYNCLYIKVKKIYYIRVQSFIYKN